MNSEIDNLSISPNPDLFQDETFEGLEEKRNLVAAKTTFPWVFIFDSVTCNADIFMTGFGLRDASDFVVSGSLGGNSSTCLALRTNQGHTPAETNYHNFVSSQGLDGTVSWYKSTSDSGTFSSLTISTNNVLVSYYKTFDTVLRILKLSISTGAWVSEHQVTPSFSAATFDTDAKIFRSQVTTSTARNYAAFNGIYSGSSYYSGLIKFDENLYPTWRRYWSYEQQFLSMDVGSQNSLVLTHTCVYSPCKWFILNLNETTGQTLMDLYFTQTTTAHLQTVEGSIRMDVTTPSVWVAAMKDVPSDANAHDRVILFRGTHSYVSTSSALSYVNYQHLGSARMKNPQIESIPGSKIIFTVIQSPTELVTKGDDYVETEKVLLIIIDISGTGFSPISSQYLQKGDSNFRGYSGKNTWSYTTATNLFLRYYAKTSGFYIAYQVPQYLKPNDYSRIVYFKVSTTGEALGFSCPSSVWTPSTAPTSSLYSSIGGSTGGTWTNYDATPGSGSSVNWYANIYTSTNISAASPTATALSNPYTNLVNLTVVPDYDFAPDAFIQYTRSCSASSTSSTCLNSVSDAQGSLVSRHVANDQSASQFYRFGVSSCTVTNLYNCSALTYPNKTAVNTALTNPTLKIATSSGLSNYMDAQIQFGSNLTLDSEYVGSDTLQLTCALNNGADIIYPHVRYNVIPTSQGGNAHAYSSSYDSASDCETPIYPFFYGNDGDVQINHMSQGATDNQFQLAGSANMKPFAPYGTVSKGFLGLFDLYGNPYWIYHVDVNATTTQSTQCNHIEAITGTTVAGVCDAYNYQLSQQQGVVAVLSSDYGTVQAIKFLPTDYSGTYNSPFLVAVNSDHNLVIAMRYSFYSSTTTIHYGFAVLVVDQTLSTKLMFKSYDINSIPSTAIVSGYVYNYGFIAIVDNDSAWKTARINTEVGTTLGFVTGAGAITNFASDKKTLCNGYSNIVVNGIVNSGSSTVTINYLAPDSFSFQDIGTTYFTSTSLQNTFQSASAIYDVTGYYHVLISGEQFLYLKYYYGGLFSTLRVWDFQGSSTSGYYAGVGAFQYSTSNNELFMAATGKWTSSSKQSSLITRVILDSLDSFNDYSCVAFREPYQSEYESGNIYYYEHTSTASSSWSTYSSSYYYYEDAIYRHTEFLTPANGVSLKTFTFSEPYEWGFNLIPDHYDFRVPQLNYQCGAYARQNSYSTSNVYTVTMAGTTQTITSNTDYSDDFLIITQGEKATITLKSPVKTCQERPITINVITARNGSQIEAGFITYDSTNQIITIDTQDIASSHRMLLQNDSVPAPGTYALIVRYQDTVDEDTYYDNKLTIIIKPNTTTLVPDNTDDSDDSKCYQNVYPVSYGGCSNACSMTVDSFHYDVVTSGSPPVSKTNIYVGGSVSQNNLFVENLFDTYADAYVMKVNHVGIPVWYTSISLSRSADETITALTLADGNYIYAFMTTLENSINLRQTAMIKLDNSDGIIIQQKSINIYNPRFGAFSFNSVRDLQQAPGYMYSSARVLALSFTYIIKGSQINAGNLKILDNKNPTEEESTWVVNSFRSMQENGEYEYLAGTQLYQEDTSASDAYYYYESHLYYDQATTTSYFYYARIYENEGLDDTIDSNGAAYIIPVQGKLPNNKDALLPKLTYDSDYNIYGIFFTEDGDPNYSQYQHYYLFQHNTTNSVQLLSLQKFKLTVLRSYLADNHYVVENLDMLFIPSLSQLMVIMNVNTGSSSDTQGFLYFLVDTSFQIQSKVRYDNFTTATTMGRLGFYDGNNYFTYIRNTPSFANSGTGNNEVLVNRKALLYSDDNEYDCSASLVLPQDSNTNTEGGYELTPIGATDVYITSSLSSFTRIVSNSYYPYVTSGYFEDIIVDNPYISSVYVPKSEIVSIYPAQSSSVNNLYGVGTETCTLGSAVQPPQTVDLPAIVEALNSGIGTQTFSSSSFSQCQDLPVNFTFQYEDGTPNQTANNVFLNYTQDPVSGDVTLTWDLTDFSPAPSVRLLSFYANTQYNTNDYRPVSVVQPFIITPQVPDAPAITTSQYYDCEADNDFPKVVGDIQNDFYSNDADIDPNNGNVLMCGYSDANGFPNSNFASQQKTAINFMADLNGNIAWTYAGQYIGVNIDIQYVSCQIHQTDSTFSLLYVEENSALAMVKQSYTTGIYQYAKYIPGKFDSFNNGFVLFDLTTTVNNVATTTLYAYIYGHRHDLGSAYNSFAKFNFDGDYPFQIWNAYSTSTSPNTEAYIETMGQSDDAVFALSQVTLGTDPYANIVKYDAISGQQLASLSYHAGNSSNGAYPNSQFSMVVLGDDHLIYISASDYNNTDHNYYKFIRRTDLDLVEDDSVQFVVTQTSYTRFITDLATNDTVLFEIFSYSTDQYYLVTYLRQTLDMISYKTFAQTNMNVYNHFILTFHNTDGQNLDETWVLSFATAQGFLAADKYSGVINKYNTDLISANPCLETFYTDLLTPLMNTTATGPLASAGQESTVSYFYTPSYYNLQPATNIYWELKRFPKQIQFQPALQLNCKASGLVLPDPLQHQIIQLPMVNDEDRIYSFRLPEICDSQQLGLEITVDKYAALPSFISYSVETTFEGTFGRVVFAKNISDSDVGTYNLRVNVYKLSDASQSVQDSFVLHIYPSTPYGSDIESIECQDKYNFMSYGGIVGNIYSHIDILTSGDSQGDYVICGANKLVNNQNTGFYSAFLQKNTQGHAVQWHLTMEAGATDNVALACQVRNDGVVVTVVNSADYTNSFNDTIYLFQHDLDAQFVNAKQVQNLDQLFEADGFYLDRLSGDMYVNGVVDGYALSHTSKGFFIMKLDINYQLVFYSAFDFGKEPTGGQFAFNPVAKLDDGTTTGTIISNFGYKSDFIESYRWGLVALDSTTGLVHTYNSINSVTTLANGLEISRNSTRTYQQQGLLLDNQNQYLYSCLIYFASEIHDEVALTQHDATNLEARMNLEFSRGYLPIETCQIQWRTFTDGQADALVMAVGTFEYTNIFAFDITDTQIINRTHLGLVYYHQRYNPYKFQMFEINHEFSLSIRTNGFDLNEDKLFLTKFSDIDTPSWDDPCNASEIQFDSTQTFYLSMNAPNGTGINELSNWQTLDYAFKQVSNISFESFYIGNPQNFTEYIIEDETRIYRDSFLNCSRYSLPTPPEEVISLAGEVKDLTTPLVVRDNSYVIQFLPFSQCSYDAITHEVVYQDGTTIAEFMVFDKDTLTFTIAANSNDLAGTYLLSYRAYVDGDDTFISSYDFQILIEANLPPYPVLNGFTDDVTMYSSHTKIWTVLLDFDPEGDTAEFGVALLDTNGVQLSSATWFSVVSSNSTALVFEAVDPTVTNPTTGDQYYVNVTVYDKFNVDTPNSYQFSLQIKPDSAPYLDTTKLSLQQPTQYQGVPFTFMINGSDFIDKEGDTPIISCDILTTAPDYNWLTFTQDDVANTLTYSYDGSPLSAYYNTLYVFVCAVTDEYLPYINFYQFRITLAENQQVVTTDVKNTTIIRNQLFIFPDLYISCVDPENQTITRTIQIVDLNGNTYTPASDQYSVTANNAFFWDPTTVTLGVDFTMKTQVGNFTITETCDDNFPRDDPAPTVVFALNLIDNLPPYVVTPLNSSNIWTFAGPDQFITVNITGVFKDPEGDELYIEVRSATDGNPPTTISTSVANNEMVIEIPNAVAGTVYNLLLKATDPVLQSATIAFTATVKQCDQTCLTCFNGGANACLTCQPGLFFYQNTCYGTCPVSTYQSGNQCLDCPTGCTTCSGSDSTKQCSQCQTPDYYLKTNADNSQGCYRICPEGYKVDATSLKCVAAMSPLYYECTAFVTNFTATTDTYIQTFSELVSQTEYCSDMNVDCPVGQEPTPGTCSWDRKLAIQCREKPDGTVMIRIATNSMPDHCMSPFNTFPVENNIDFEVQFSIPVSNLTKVSLQSQQLVDQYQCSSSWTASTNLVKTHNYTDNSGDVTGIVGISINGVPIHAGLSENNYDYFAPKGGLAAKRVEVDSCLGSNYNSNYYHYYSFSPCVFTNSISLSTTAVDCADLQQCNSDYLKYAIANLPTSQRVLAVVGLARDGHMIIGPYKNAGALWQPCDVDACNGVTVNGQYVYASTLFYPYTVACWGPATKQSEYGASCSSNTNTCYSFSIFLNASSMLMLVIFALFLMW